MIQLTVGAGDVVNASFGIRSLGTESNLRAGDTNGDGRVDFADFLTLFSNFGQQVDHAFADGDFDGNGKVDFSDFLLLSSEF